jgi:peptidoglycan hydrolase-like protein with peptidoglycan-binding domain
MTSLRCHFDADGWLQGPISITHLFTPNHGTGFGTGRGVVLHTEDGFEAGTVATFMNPANQVSAFFSVGVDGAVHQYVPVGKGLTAWSQVAGNGAWRGVETEDKTSPSTPLTQAQITTFAQILEACSAFDGFPLQVTDNVNGQGLILHSDGGEAWGGHFSCPGSVRAAQRPVIVALAMSIRQGGSAPAQDWQEALMNKLPALQQGAADKAGAVFYVHRMQALLACVGRIKAIPSAACVIASGEFDAGTAAGLKAVQGSFGLTQDGVCGPQTWGVLVAGSAT